MSTIPYLSQGQGIAVDPLTGLPKKKKPPAYTQQQVSLSLGRNPLGTFGPSAGVNYTQPGRTAAPAVNPDYGSLIAAAIGPLQAQLGAEGVADLTSRNNQIIRGLGQFGEQFDPAGAQQAFGTDFFQQSGLGDLLPQANQLAQQTTDAGVSFSARAKQAHDRGVQQIQDALAARGLLRSGAAGVALQDQQRQFETGQYDARSQLQDFFQAVNEGYAQAQRQRAMQLDAAQREEAGRQAELNPMSGVPAGGYGPAAMTPGLGAEFNAPAPPASESPAQQAERARRDALIKRFGFGGAEAGFFVG